MQSQSLPYENIPALMQVLKESFTGDNQSVQRATQTLQAMAQDPMMFLNSLMRVIIMEKTDTETIHIKTAAVLGLTRCLMDLMKENKIPAEQRNFIIEAVIGAMFSDHVTLPMKVNLQYFLIYMYTVDVGSEMTNKGLNLVKEKLTSNNLHDYPPAFLLLQAVINTAQAPQESIASWFDELKEPLITIGGGLTRGIMVEIQSFTGTNPSQEKVTGVFVGLKILKMWILTIHEFIKLLGSNNAKKKLKPTHLRVVLIQEHLVQVLSAIIMMTIPSDKQIKDCVFSTSGLPELDQLLNTVKTSALKSFTKVLDLMEDLNTVVAPADNKFFTFSKNYYLHTFLSSLVIFFRNENLNVEAIQNDKDLTELIVEALTFLEKMANFSDLYPTFSAYIKHLIVDVCFSLIRTTNAEIEQFKTDPAQFVEDALDVIGPQKSQTAKAQAAKFLTKLCSVLDGALSYAALVSLCLIDYSMVSDNRSQIPDTHKDLTEYINSIIIAKTDPNVRVESCLVVITILSNLIGKRSDLVVLIEGLLTNYSQFFLGNQSTAITKARVCLLLSSYVHILFRKDDQKEAYTLHLRFLLECAGLENEEFSSLVEQANTALHSMFERAFLTAALAPYVCDFLERFTVYVLYVKTHKMFDIIHEIVTTYDKQILEKPELLVNLTEALVKRWELEFEITRKDPKANKIMLNKIWNVVRGIGGKEEYVRPLQEEIEKRLITTFKYLDINENLHFDEDILNYVASVTKITQKVSAASWEVFRKFPSIFERYQGLLTHLFPALNQIIIYGQEVINSDETAIETLIDIGKQALNPSHHAADESNFSEGAVLLQLILQYVHPISQERLRTILLACYDKLQGAENDFLKARLGDVFLCAFLKNFEATQAILSNVQILQPLMDLFLKDVLVFETQAYDRKLLVIGLSSLLHQPNLSPEIESRLPEIFDVIVSFLRYIGYMEQREAKRNLGFFIEESDSDAEDRKTSNKDILLKFLDNKDRLAATIDEDDDTDKDEDDDDEEHYVFGKTEANSVIRNLETDLKSKDEFVCFQEAIYLMKQNRPQVFEALVQSLAEKKQLFLNEVLQSRRINTEQEGKTQARKIVRVGAKKIAQVQIDNPPNQ